jgi:hypothetical protein
LTKPISFAYRYPGRSATKAGVQEALKNCREVRGAARTGFGLPL